MMTTFILIITFYAGKYPSAGLNPPDTVSLTPIELNTKAKCEEE